MPVFMTDENMVWKRRGHCVTSGANPEKWHSDRNPDRRLAKALCDSCPVTNDCLSYALRNREPFGIWGGERFERGRIVPLLMARGPKPKSKVPAPRTSPESASA